MLLVNFAHPLTDANLEQLRALLGESPTRTVGALAQIDHAQPLDPQVEALLDATGLTPDEWQTLPFVVNLPGFAPAAACAVAQLHGRMGHFPTVLRLRPVEGSTPTRYEIAELLNLQSARDTARLRRL